MTESNEFTGLVTRIEPGGSGATALKKLNLPFDQIEGALNKLAGRIAGLSDKDGVIRHYAPLSASCYVGALVYYNPDPSRCRFEPAMAVLLPHPGEQGQSVEAPCARVEGMVLSIDSAADGSNTVMGTLLCGGFHESLDAAQGCLGASATAGTYYLSPDQAGRAVPDPGSHLRQPVLSYYGNGKFSLSLLYMAHDNHFHASLETGSHWKPAASAPSQAPAGMLSWYDLSEDPAGSDLGELSEDVTAVFSDGVLQPRTGGELTVRDGMLWCRFEAPRSSVTLFNHYPFAYGSPVVRSVVAEGPGLEASSVNGTVRLKVDNYRQVGADPSGEAVMRLDGRTMSMTPVVTELESGLGVRVSKLPSGRRRVSLSSLAGSLMDAYDVNHNGTNMTSDGVFLYFTFPGGRQSSMTVTCPLNLDEGAGMRARLWACGAGPGSSFSVSLYWIPVPAAGQPMPFPGGPAAVSDLTVSGGSGQLSYAETPDSIPVSGRGLLAASIGVKSKPASDIRLLRIGFKIDEEA